MTRSGVAAGCAAIAAVVATGLAWDTTTTNNTTTATKGAAPLALDGRQLFLAKGCAGCHAGPDSSADFESAPSLKAARSWAATRKPDLSASEYISESILAPLAFISPRFRSGSAGPMTGMPDLGLTPEEVEALATYLLDS